jgi:hypothetical protein
MITQRYKDQLRVNGLNKCFDVILRPCPKRLEYGVPLTALTKGLIYWFLLCIM